MGQQFFFTIQDPSGQLELWRTDGTASGTSDTASLSQPGATSNYLIYFDRAPSGSALIETQSNTSSGFSFTLYAFDGTSLTTLANATNPQGYAFRYGGTIGGEAIFSNYDPATGGATVLTDGTAAHTTTLPGYNYGTWTLPGGVQLLETGTGISGSTFALYALDGTRLTILASETDGNAYDYRGTLGGKAIFSHYDPATGGGTTLFTDGTTAHTTTLSGYTWGIWALPGGAELIETMTIIGGSYTFTLSTSDGTTLTNLASTTNANGYAYDYYGSVGGVAVFNHYNSFASDRTTLVTDGTAAHTTTVSGNVWGSWTLPDGAGVIETFDNSGGVNTFTLSAIDGTSLTTLASATDGNAYEYRGTVGDETIFSNYDYTTGGGTTVLTDGTAAHTTTLPGYTWGTWTLPGGTELIEIRAVSGGISTFTLYTFDGASLNNLASTIGGYPYEYRGTLGGETVFGLYDATTGGGTTLFTDSTAAHITTLPFDTWGAWTLPGGAELIETRSISGGVNTFTVSAFDGTSLTALASTTTPYNSGYDYYGTLGGQAVFSHNDYVTGDRTTLLTDGTAAHTITLSGSFWGFWTLPGGAGVIETFDNSGGAYTYTLFASDGANLARATGDASTFPYFYSGTVGGEAIFSLYDLTTGTSTTLLTDGTTAGTGTFQGDLYPWSASTLADGTFLLPGRDHGSGGTLFITDGTAAGTHPLKDFVPGTTGENVTSKLLALGIATPTAPVGLADAAIEGGYVNAAHDTASQTLTGTADAGSTVKVYDRVALLGSTSADDLGNWSYTLGTLVNGAHSLTATATNTFGTTGAESSALVFTVDTVAPLIAITSSGGLTNQVSQTVAGTGEAGTTITILDGVTALGSMTVAADSTWSMAVVLGADGAHTITAQDADAAGNIGTSAPVTLTLDTTPPNAPFLRGVDADTDIAGDAITSDHTPALYGTAEPGAAVTVYRDGALLGHVMASAADGSWTYQDGALTDGVYLYTATATDAAGNISDAGSLQARIFAGAVTMHGGPYWGERSDGGWGNDSIDIGGGSDSLYGYGGNDTLRAAGYGNLLDGGDGDDSLDGGQGNSTLDGGAGDNTLHVLGYNSVIRGGNGHNTLTGPQGNSDVKFGDGGNSIVVGGYGNTITTGTGQDDITSGQGNATIHSGGGGDLIRLGQGGGNRVDAGGGGTVFYALNSAGVSGHQNSDGSWTVQLPGGNDRLVGVDSLVFGDRTITLATDLPLVPDALPSSTGGGGYNAVVYGTAGNDALDGGLGNARVYALDGNDVIIVRGYNDSIIGGSGSKTLTGPEGNATVRFGDGPHDVTLGGYGNVVTLGAGGGQVVLGQGNSSLMQTGGGNLRVVADGYGNSVSLGDGDSTVLLYRIGGNVVDGGGGIDKVTYTGMSGNGVTWTHNGDGSWTMQLPGTGTDTLRHVELVRFADGMVDLSSGNPTATLMTDPDFNGDGRGDLLFRHDDGTAYVWQMDGASISGGASLGQVPFDWTLLGAGDFDGDKKADLLWRNDAGGLYLWEMDGPHLAHALPVADPGAGWNVAGIADFDGDGKADLLWRNGQGHTYLWEMDGASLVRGVDIGAIPNEWRVAVTADFDGDGKADILWQHAGDGALYLWTMAAGQVATQGTIGVLGSTWQLAGYGDLNGDKKTDLVFENAATGEVYAWLMDGLGIGAQGGLGTLPKGWHVKLVEDLGGDGKADIILGNAGGDLWLMTMDGLRVTAQDSLGSVGAAWHMV